MSAFLQRHCQNPDYLIKAIKHSAYVLCKYSLSKQPAQTTQRICLFLRSIMNQHFVNISTVEWQSLQKELILILNNHSQENFYSSLMHVGGHILVNIPNMSIKTWRNVCIMIKTTKYRIFCIWYSHKVLKKVFSFLGKFKDEMSALSPI